MFFGPYTLLPCRADSLGLGVLVALASRNERCWLGARRRPLAIAFAILFAGVAALTVHPQGRLMNSIGCTWLAAFYATALLLSAVNPGRAPSAFLGWRPLQVLGALAYGVYLFHQGANAIAHAVFFGRAPKLEGAAAAGATALAAVVTFVIAKLSWRLFEKPLVARGHARFHY